MTPRPSSRTRGPRGSPHRRSQGISVNESKFRSLLRRTNKVLGLRSASNAMWNSKGQVVRKGLDLRSEYSPLRNSHNSRNGNRRSSASSRSSLGSTSAYAGIYDPTPGKVQLTMSVDLEFLFCVNRTKVSADNHPLRPLHSRQPDRGLDQLKRIFLINGLTINEALTPAALDVNNWNIAPNIDAEYFNSQEDAVRVLRSTGRMDLQSIFEWDLTGAQLISRELAAPECDSWSSSAIQSRRADKSLLEISDYVKALTDTESLSLPWFMLTRPDVNHVGISIGTGRGERRLNEHLDMLKHLALMLVEYEDIISLYHHPDRRGWTDARANTRSHRYGAKDNPHICGTLSPINVLDIESQIFGCRDIHSLAQLMESEYEESASVRFIDWRSLADFGRLTFFQHAGSRDMVEIGYWICFVVTVFRVAERRSLGILGPPCLAGLDVDMRIGEVSRLWVFESQERRADQLLKLLGLSRSDSKYWQGRMHQYAKDEYLRRYQTSGFEKCPACEAAKGNFLLEELTQSPTIQNQLGHEVAQLGNTNLIPHPPFTHADIEALTAEHIALSREISAFTESLGLVPTKHSRAGPFVWQTFELTQDYIALESQIETLSDRLFTADAKTAAEIHQTLRDDQQLHREIEQFLKTQPNTSTLGEHRLIRELHQLRISHARLGATIDTLRRQAVQIPPAIQLTAGMYGPGLETLRQRGPHMQALVQDMVSKMQQVRAAHADTEQGLRRDRAVLEALDGDERRLQRENANGERLRDLAATFLDRPRTVFENGGPDWGKN